MAGLSAAPPAASLMTPTRSSCTCDSRSGHRRRWRSTDLLEPSLSEVKRRTKVMGRFPGKTSCLTLVWAVLDLLITHETNGIRFNQPDRQRLTHTVHRQRATHPRENHSRLNSPPSGNQIYSAKETPPLKRSWTDSLA